MNKVCLFFFAFVSFTRCFAQYAPQVGLGGSTAISASSSLFTGWATGCVVARGYMNIDSPALGYASSGDSSLALGPADNYVVSLGDSGVATLTFATPIYDGPGADFAVFENGFPNMTNDSLAFLELAFVEVSSDGVNYTRFPARSLTQTNTQVGNGDYTYANNLNNLAGKYLAKYGTPFDLLELTGTAGLDVGNITHVRIIDVVGSIGAHASHDATGNIINDPYPTPFATCGFDLDAVGLINHVSNAAVVNAPGDITVTTYPNPFTDKLVVDVGNCSSGTTFAVLTDLTGRILIQQTLSQSVNEMAVGQLAAGMYYLVLHDTNGNRWVEKVTKR
jgi:type IX secretion system substrate protein